MNGILKIKENKYARFSTNNTNIITVLWIYNLINHFVINITLRKINWKYIFKSRFNWRRRICRSLFKKIEKKIENVNKVGITQLNEGEERNLIAVFLCNGFIRLLRSSAEFQAFKAEGLGVVSGYKFSEIGRASCRER